PMRRISILLPPEARAARESTPEPPALQFEIPQTAPRSRHRYRRVKELVRAPVRVLCPSASERQRQAHPLGSGTALGILSRRQGLNEGFPPCGRPHFLAYAAD